MIDRIEGETTVMSQSNGKQHGSASNDEQAAVSPYFARKNWPMRIVGAVLLLLASPLIALLVLIVRCTSPGRGIYKQARTGRLGREFMMFKIRTMYEDAESISGPVWCRPGDSRVTPVGRVLRLLHLDELPQLINVMRGEMDLVGPRPERPIFVSRLAREIPNYRVRLEVLPGVTGLAQVNLPPDETLDCVRRKIVLDCDYVRTASLGLDLRILMCTLLRMLGIRHGRAVRWLGLERAVSASFQTRDARRSWQRAKASYAPLADAYVVNGGSGLEAAAVTADSACSTLIHEPSVAIQPPTRPR